MNLAELHSRLLDQAELNSVLSISDVKTTIEKLLTNSVGEFQPSLPVTLERLTIECASVEAQFEVALLRVRLIDATDIRTIRQQFLTLCAEREERIGDSALSLFNSPDSPANILYWEIACLLFAPASLTEMLRILRPALHDSVLIEPLPSHFQNQRSSLSASPQVLRPMPANCSQQQPTLREQQNFQVIINPSDATAMTLYSSQKQLSTQTKTLSDLIYRILEVLNFYVFDCITSQIKANRSRFRVETADLLKSEVAFLREWFLAQSDEPNLHKKVQALQSERKFSQRHTKSVDALMDALYWKILDLILTSRVSTKVLPVPQRQIDHAPHQPVTTPDATSRIFTYSVTSYGSVECNELFRPRFSRADLHRFVAAGGVLLEWSDISEITQSSVGGKYRCQSRPEKQIRMVVDDLAKVFPRLHEQLVALPKARKALEIKDTSPTSNFPQAIPTDYLRVLMQIFPINSTREFRYQVSVMPPEVLRLTIGVMTIKCNLFDESTLNFLLSPQSTYPDCTTVQRDIVIEHILRTNRNSSSSARAINFALQVLPTDRWHVAFIGHSKLLRNLNWINVLTHYGVDGLIGLLSLVPVNERLGHMTSGEATTLAKEVFRTTTTPHNRHFRSGGLSSLDIKFEKKIFKPIPQLDTSLTQFLQFIRLLPPKLSVEVLRPVHYHGKSPLLYALGCYGTNPFSEGRTVVVPHTRWGEAIVTFRALISHLSPQELWQVLLEPVNESSSATVSRNSVALMIAKRGVIFLRKVAMLLPKPIPDAVNQELFKNVYISDLNDFVNICSHCECAQLVGLLPYVEVTFDRFALEIEHFHSRFEESKLLAVFKYCLTAPDTFLTQQQIITIIITAFAPDRVEKILTDDLGFKDWRTHLSQAAKNELVRSDEKKFQRLLFVMTSAARREFTNSKTGTACIEIALKKKLYTSLYDLLKTLNEQSRLTHLQLSQSEGEQPLQKLLDNFVTDVKDRTALRLILNLFTEDQLLEGLRTRPAAVAVICETLCVDRLSAAALVVCRQRPKNNQTTAAIDVNYPGLAIRRVAENEKQKARYGHFIEGMTNVLQKAEALLDNYVNPPFGYILTGHLFRYFETYQLQIAADLLQWLRQKPAPSDDEVIIKLYEKLSELLIYNQKQTSPLNPIDISLIRRIAICLQMPKSGCCDLPNESNVAPATGLNSSIQISISVGPT